MPAVGHSAGSVGSPGYVPWRLTLERHPVHHQPADLAPKGRIDRGRNKKVAKRSFFGMLITNPQTQRGRSREKMS
jgi:hypothetical protein